MHCFRASQGGSTFLQATTCDWHSPNRVDGGVGAYSLVLGAQSKEDAHGEVYRTGRARGKYDNRRELGRVHAMVVQDVVRVQNRIKAQFRSRGVAVAGKSVYSEKGRDRRPQNS